ncbi:MAG TPA: ATP-binding cassette domain-containing protein [Protaetiibacter sp.]|nr:ATP-binding cassette domain-containing protein [Protaetiibacter sp.]
MTGGALDAHIVLERRDFRLDAEVALAPGEVGALMGPSGAGKSTLLAAIAGLVRAPAGQVRIDGTELGGTRAVPPHRRGVVLLGQEARLFPHLTARDNIAFGMRAHGLPRHTARTEAERWLGRVGLEGFGDRRPAELSGGQQQRVALARALATAPRILLLDEPLTSLDPETAGEVRALLSEQLRAAGATALVVTHDALDAASLASRLLILEDGVVTQAGAVREVLAAPATRFAAAVAGTNRVLGVAEGGCWKSGGGTHPVILRADDEASHRAAARDGTPLAALVRPSDVELETLGSAWRYPDAGEWDTRIVRLDHTPGGARVQTADPPLAVDVSADTVASLGLAPGLAVRLRVAPGAVRFAGVVPRSGDDGSSRAR